MTHLDGCTDLCDVPCRYCICDALSRATKAGRSLPHIEGCPMTLPSAFDDPEPRCECDRISADIAEIVADALIDEWLESR